MKPLTTKLFMLSNHYSQLLGEPFPAIPSQSWGGLKVGSSRLHSFFEDDGVTLPQYF